MLALLGLITASKLQSATANMTYEEFKQKVSAISIQAGQLTAASTLLSHPEFRALSKSADNYQSLAEQFLASDAPASQKAIVIYAMANLSFDNYVSFIRHLLAMTKKGSVDSSLLEWALIPGFEWNTKLQDNYQSEKVSQLIRDLRASRLLTQDCLTYLNEIESGEGAREVQRMRRDGEIP
jgi:hypothetical protein